MRFEVHSTTPSYKDLKGICENTMIPFLGFLIAISLLSGNAATSRNVRSDLLPINGWPGGSSVKTSKGVVIDNLKIITVRDACTVNIIIVSPSPKGTKVCLCTKIARNPRFEVFHDIGLWGEAFVVLESPASAGCW